MVTDTNLRALALRNALTQMTIRYGSSTQSMAYAESAERWENAARHRRARHRRFAAVQRLARALAGQST